MMKSIQSNIISNACVLVVDDTPLHRHIAIEILSRHGFAHAAAENGQQAHDAVTHSPFAAILMDCQMPVMDGLTATKAIRALELTGKSASTRRLPIIAVTACQSHANQQLCRSAGMDAFLPKPAQESTLLPTLHSLLKGETVEWTPPSTFVAQLDLLNWQAFSTTCMGDPSLMRTMAGHFQRQADADWREIAAANAAGNWEELRKTAHRLKGAAAYLAAEPLRAAAELLEKTAKAQDRDKAYCAYVDLERKLHDTRAALDVHVSQLAAAEPAPASTDCNPAEEL